MIYLLFSRVFSCFLLYCLFIIFESSLITKAFSDKSETAFFIQCSRLIPFSFILCISQTPSSSAEISFSTSPLKRIHGTPNLPAMSETLLGSLPNSVCLSVLPLTRYNRIGATYFILKRCSPCQHVKSVLKLTVQKGG